MATEPRIGTRIRRARERKRWTQQQLADAVGVNVKTVNNWETGRTAPANSLGALEQALDVSLDEAQPEEPVFEDPKERELWELRSFTPSERWDLIHEYRRRARQAG